MRKIRPVLSGLLGAGLLVGLTSLPGCGNSEMGSMPEMKGTKDEIQKAQYELDLKAAKDKTKRR